MKSIGLPAVVLDEPVVTTKWSSEVPTGAGVSSSAALEVASLLAISGLLAVPIDGLNLAPSG